MEQVDVVKRSIRAGFWFDGPFIGKFTKQCLVYVFRAPNHLLKVTFTMPHVAGGCLKLLVILHGALLKYLCLETPFALMYTWGEGLYG